MKNPASDINVATRDCRLLFEFLDGSSRWLSFSTWLSRVSLPACSESITMRRPV